MLAYLQSLSSAQLVEEELRGIHYLVDLIMSWSRLARFVSVEAGCSGLARSGGLLRAESRRRAPHRAWPRATESGKTQKKRKIERERDTHTGR